MEIRGNENCLLKKKIYIEIRKALISYFYKGSFLFFYRGSGNDWIWAQHTEHQCWKGFLHDLRDGRNSVGPRHVPVYR